MIRIYAADCDDFDNNGLGVLTPLTCTVDETLNGSWEVKLEHLIDEEGKWKYLQYDNILRVPVPASITPYVEVKETTTTGSSSSGGSTGTGTSTVATASQIKNIISTGKVTVASDTTTYGTVHVDTEVSLRAGPGSDYKRYGVYSTGSIATVLGSENGYYHVIMSDGTEGYVDSVGWEESTTEYTYTAPSAVATKPSQATVTTTIKETIEARQLRDQPFRIYRVVTEMDKITVYARHIFYDLMDNWIIKYTEPDKGSGNKLKAHGYAVLRDMMSKTMNSNEFTFYSDLETYYKPFWEKFTIEDKNPVEAILGSDGFIDAYGGELKRDWYDVFIVERIGNDTDVQIREKKNLTSVTYDIDTSNVITRIIPTSSNTQDGTTIYLPEKYISSERESKYPHPKYGTIQCEEANLDFSEYIVDGVDYSHLVKDDAYKNAYQDLRSAAKEEFEKGADLPTLTINVDFINLFDTEEYSNFEALQNIYIGDAVKVIAPSIGVSVSMRMTQYTYDCVLKKYTKMTLGSIGSTVESSVITSKQIAQGSITSGKLALDSVSAGNLQDGSVNSLAIQNAAIKTAHISRAAIDSLVAGSLEANQANIKALAAGTISSDELISAYANIIALYVNKLEAGDIEADSVAAALAKFEVITAGTANFDRETVKKLVANLLTVDEATGGKVFIKNLMVDYASMVQANVGSLVVGASDGNYYKLDVDSQGNVTATLQEVSDTEKANGQTEAGKTILETNIVASDLSASSIKAASALINKLDAARIDVATLVATDAYISHLKTADISNNESIRVAIESGNSVSRYMKFDNTGLVQRVPGNEYYTRIDNDGFDVCSEHLLDPIASMNAYDGLNAGTIVVGDMICRKSSRNGWVWQVRG